MPFLRHKASYIIHLQSLIFNESLILSISEAFPLSDLAHITKMTFQATKTIQ